MKALIMLCTVALLAGACGHKEKSEPAKAATVKGAKTVPGVPRDTIIDAHMIENGPNYKIDATYPAIARVTPNAAVNAYVAKMVSEFKANIEKDSASHHWTYELKMTYRASMDLPGIVSYELDTYSFTGGAHGMTFIQTFNYDVAGDKMLALADLFTLPTFPDTLSVLSFDLLKQTLDTNVQIDMIESGTKPVPESFEKFQLLPAGLQIHFQAYDVAPYSYGAQQVTISYERLKKILKPEIYEAVTKQ